MNNLLQIQNLSFSVENKEIVRGLDFSINKGEIHAIMGPNGSGKSSLALFLAGHPSYNENAGSVIFKGKSLSALNPSERALSGLFVSFQNPISIPGVSVSTVLRTSLNAKLKSEKKSPIDVANFHKMIRPIFAELKLDTSMLTRDFNDGFSGGERKKIEMLFYKLFEPDLAIFDEIDSGLDIDAVKLIAQTIKKSKSRNRSVILITHYNRILKYLKPDFVHIYKDGSIVKKGDFSLALQVEKNGYGSF